MLNTIMRNAINISRAIGANNFSTLKSAHYNYRNLVTQYSFVDEIDFVSLIDMLQPSSITASFKPYGPTIWQLTNVDNAFRSNLGTRRQTRN
ncbi:hypothetical protein BHQ29_20785 [Pseudomonas sp. LPH1]|nr:hypothetical protein BHQ29_20785 [Pseudomonas sp. LPH1]